MSEPGIWGEEFLVNAVTTSAQMSPVITALVGGRFAIAYTDYSRTWREGFTDYSSSAVRVQVFSTDGAALSEVVQVNTVSSYTQDSPRIAPLADGGFVVTYADGSLGWDSSGDDAWAGAVRMQMFTADADKLETETLVNTTVFGDQDYPTVALLENGRFLVSWDDGDSDVDENISAQLFNADGSFAGGEFRVNETTTGSQTGSDIAGLPGGGYVVTWVDADGVDGEGGTIMARIFAADGTPAGLEFQVNTTATGDQYQPSVTRLAGGGFFIAWTDNSRGVETGGDDTVSFAIRGQVFDATGAPVGTEFRVNTVTANGQVQPDVLALADGRFIVAYSDTSQGVETGGDDTEIGAIRARIFNADGSPDGDEFLVNVTTAGHQNEPQMTQLLDGRVVFTWTDYSYGVSTGGDDASNGAIRARILDLRQSAAEWVGSDADEEFIGTIWNDKLVGDGGNDSLVGADGDDTLLGRDGNDWIDGGSGADTLKGHAGGDTLYGDAGADKLRGGGGDDVLHGGGGSDYIKGDSGHDHMRGDSGSDELIGGSGEDTLDGGSGADRLSGGNHDDQIIGGLGTDRLTGGKGADTFVFVDPRDSRNGSSKRDVITDFHEGEDRIDLSVIDIDDAAANQRLTFIDHDKFSGTRAEIRYTHNDTRSLIRIDLDGDGSTDMQIELSNWHLLKASDFIL